MVPCCPIWSEVIMTRFLTKGSTRGRLTIWKPGQCPRARDAPGTFFIVFFEFGQGHRGPMIPYCPG
ncbi:unnamed protein product, partial [Staurois parvus]